MKKILDWIRDNRNLERFLTGNRDMIIKVAASAMLIVAAFFIFLSGGDKEAGVQEEDVAVTAAAEEERVSIYVDIGGEVVNPMVAELKEGSRVEDAIKAAGGVTEFADLTEINRAAFVEDGEKIFIPTMIQYAASDGSGSGTAADIGNIQRYEDDRVNINTADSEELQQLNGVGPATAEKIIEYREENGRFGAIEEIKEVSGIGEKTFEKFRDEIRV